MKKKKQQQNYTTSQIQNTRSSKTDANSKVDNIMGGGNVYIMSANLLMTGITIFLILFTEVLFGKIIYMKNY